MLDKICYFHSLPAADTHDTVPRNPPKPPCPAVHFAGLQGVADHTFRQQHIGGLDVAVDDERPLRVQECQAVCDLDAPLQPLAVCVHNLRTYWSASASTLVPLHEPAHHAAHGGARSVGSVETNRVALRLGDHPRGFFYADSPPVCAASTRPPTNVGQWAISTVDLKGTRSIVAPSSP